MEFSEKHRKNRDTNQAHIFHHNFRIYFYKNSPVQYSKSKLCTSAVCSWRTVSTVGYFKTPVEFVPSLREKKVGKKTCGLF